MNQLGKYAIREEQERANTYIYVQLNQRTETRPRRAAGDFRRDTKGMESRLLSVCGVTLAVSRGPGLNWA